MDAKLKADWVKALRSGEYEQTKHSLFDHRTGGYCCLGVLCTVMGAEWNGDENKATLRGARLQSSSGSFIANAISDPIGLPYELQGPLARMNDAGHTFLKIADHIESNIPSDEQSKSEEPSHG